MLGPDMWVNWLICFVPYLVLLMVLKRKSLLTHVHAVYAGVFGYWLTCLVLWFTLGTTDIDQTNNANVGESSAVGEISEENEIQYE